jgi:uncharacterized membrane protein
MQQWLLPLNVFLATFTTTLLWLNWRLLRRIIRQNAEAIRQNAEAAVKVDQLQQWTAALKAAGDRLMGEVPLN